MGNHTSSRRAARSSKTAQLSMSLEGRSAMKKRLHQHHQQHSQSHRRSLVRYFGDTATSSSSDDLQAECGSTAIETRQVTLCQSNCASCKAGASSETATGSESPAESDSCSCSSITVMRDNCNLEQDELMLTIPDNGNDDECWLTRNTGFPQPVDQSGRVRDSHNAYREGCCSYQHRQNGEASPNRQIYDQLQQQPKQAPQLLMQQQQQQQLQSSEPVTKDISAQQTQTDCTYASAADISAVPAVKQSSETQQLTVSRPAAAAAAAAHQEVSSISRTVFVPQNWTSIIFFVKGSEADTIARQCRVDLTISGSSVDCSKREKDVLGTARKRAVHIRARCMEDAATTVEQLLAVMPVLVSHPDLPERSWLAREDSSVAAAAAGDTSTAAARTQAAFPAAEFEESSDPTQSAVSTAAAAVDSADSAASQAAALATASAASAAAAASASDTRTYCSRRQLNEFRPAVLEVDVENTSAGLLPFFPGSCDRRGSVVCARSGCSVEITDRMRRRPGGEERRILRVQGPSMSALEKCVRLLELHFPSMGARGHFRELRDRVDANAKQLRFA